MGTVTRGIVNLNYDEGGHGTVLVLTHGLGSDLHYWDAHVGAFRKAHRVVRWDIPGFGCSPKRIASYTPDAVAADLFSLLDQLHLEQVHLLGISMGGAVAQRFALAHPNRLRSLILVSTSSEVGARAAVAWQRVAAKIEREGLTTGVLDATRSVSPSFAKNHPEIVRRLTESACASDSRNYAAAARAFGNYDWTADLERIGAPTLILQGLDDRLTPPGGSVKMSRFLPHARLLIVPEAGHNLPIERPDLFASAVLAFTGAVDMLRR